MLDYRTISGTGRGWDVQTAFRRTVPFNSQPVSAIVKLMAKKCEDRYQSAWGIKADLERCAQQLAEIGQLTLSRYVFKMFPNSLYPSEAVRTRGGDCSITGGI